MAESGSRRFERTVQGHEEITQARKNVRGKLRTVLFLVDRTKTATEIGQQMKAIGAPPDALEQLVAAGYIRALDEAPPRAAAPPGAAVAPPPGELPPATDAAGDFRVAKAFMNETIVDVLGIRAFVFTLRLERCATLADLYTLLPDYGAALGKKLDAGAAAALVQRARELIVQKAA